MKDDSNSFSNVIPKIGDPPKGEGLLEKPLELEEISSLDIVNIKTIICRDHDLDINLEFHTIAGEIIQSIKIPASFISKIQNYEKTGIRSELQKRLFNRSQYRELVQKGGIYIFCDSTNRSIKRQIYVGESNELFTRLKNHEKIKEGIFSSIFIITSERDDIGKDKLKVLESMLIRSLKEHPAFEVTNTQKKTKFRVEFFDEPLVKKYYETILLLIEHCKL
jgi:hypothetical protein